MCNLSRKVTHARKRNPWADRDELLHRCRGPRRNHLCQFLWFPHTGFERGGGSNFGLLHWLASSPLQHSRTTVRVCDLLKHFFVFVSILFLFSEKNATIFWNGGIIISNAFGTCPTDLGFNPQTKSSSYTRVSNIWNTRSFFLIFGQFGHPRSNVCE